MSNIKWNNSKVKRVKKTSEFEALLTSDGPNMMVIYADWCVHCQSAEPILTELANTVDGKATIYAIESQDYDGELAEGYPTMLIVKKGKLSKYDGDRKVDAMESALLKGDLSGGKRSRRRGTRRLRKRARKTHRALR